MLFGSVTAKDSQIADMNASINELTSAVSVRDNDIVVKQTTIANLTEQNNSLLSQVTTLSLDRASLSTQVVNLGAQINSMTSQRDNLVTDLNDLNIKYKSLDTNYNAKVLVYNTTVDAGEELFIEFENCYWGLKCGTDVNACKVRYGDTIDVNATIASKIDSCININAGDMNLFKFYFD